MAVRGLRLPQTARTGALMTRPVSSVRCLRMGTTVTFYGTQQSAPTVAEFLASLLPEAGSVRALAGSFDADGEFQRRSVESDELVVGNQIMLKLDGGDDGVLDLHVSPWSDEGNEEDYERVELDGKPSVERLAIVASLEPLNGPTGTAYTDLVEHVLAALDARFGPGLATWAGEDTYFTQGLRQRLDSEAEPGLRLDVKLGGDEPRVRFMAQLLRDQGPDWLGPFVQEHESHVTVVGDAGSVTNASRDNAWRALLDASQYATEGHVRLWEEGKWHDVVSPVGATTVELPIDPGPDTRGGLWSLIKSIFAG